MGNIALCTLTTYCELKAAELLKKNFMPMKELPKGLIQRLLKSEGSSSSYSNGLWFMPQENKLI